MFFVHPLKVLFVILILVFSKNVKSESIELKCNLRITKETVQGGFLYGQIDPACNARLGTRKLRISKDGSFLFGFGRDASASAELSIGPANEKIRQSVQILVKPRQYAIERVNGVPQSTVTPDAKLQKRIDREQSEVVVARQRDDDRQDFSSGFIMPLQGRISGVFGSQRVLNGIPKNPHYGLDIAAPTGTPVAAPAGGVVTFAKSDLYLTGGTLVLDHGHGLSSTFIHLSRIDVKLGQRINQGDIIAAVGMTGRASGPHLHWAMNWFAERLDPQLVAEDRD